MATHGDIPEGTCELFSNGDMHITTTDTGDPDLVFFLMSTTIPWFVGFRNTRSLMTFNFNLTSGAGLSTLGTLGFKQFGLGSEPWDPSAFHPSHGLLSDNHHTISSCSNGGFTLLSQYMTMECVASSSRQRSAPAYY
eukprot:4652377-Pyramimonas_sp.AAC.1